ncbi:MAG: ImmA/IrrE family metallo-endopeptidase [Bacteroidota bacterium]
MSEKAHITPKVLKWARESAKMTLEAAASKIPNLTAEKLAEWEDENSSSQPTISQAEKLAKTYKRPFSLFFLPDIPFDFMPLQDYRRKTAKPLGTASVFIIREIQQKQAWIRDVFEENNESPLPFVGRFSIKDNPAMVAKDILDTLQIIPANYSKSNPILEWISKAEAKGIFVSRTSFINTRLKLDSDEFQGFAIADTFAPFIFINSREFKAPQLFSFVHELAHIWIAQSGVSNEIDPELKHKDKMHPVELFCNQVAANALMPEEIMNEIKAEAFTNQYEVYKAAKIIGVSSFAFLVRAFNLNKISPAKYHQLKVEAEKAYNEFVKKDEERKLKQKLEKKGFADHYLLLLNKNGRLFTQIVLDAFRGGTIQPSQASNLLNTQINNFPKLENYIYG